MRGKITSKRCLGKARSVVYPPSDCWLLLPGLCGFLSFYVIPFGVSIYNSLIGSAFTRVFVGLQNYFIVAKNSLYQLAMKNTLILAVLMPSLLIMAALLCALVMRNSPMLRLLQSNFLFPAFVPTAAAASIWQLFFAKSRDFMVALDYKGGVANSVFNGEWLSVFSMSIWRNFGITLVLVNGAFLMLDEELEQAAALDGANWIQRFCRIVFPQLKPTMMFTLVYVIMCSLRLYKEAYVLYDAYPSESIYLIQHYMNNHFAKLNYQYLSAGAIMLALIIIAAIVPLLKMMRHFSEEAI